MTAAGRRGEADAVWVGADGWVIDWIADDRARRTLEEAPASVRGVAACPEPLVPGASYRSAAERQCLRDNPPPAEASARHGAPVLVRPDGDPAGDPIVNRGGVVQIEGTVWADRAVHAHRRAPDTEPVATAVAEGRPPFRSRPVVAFVQGGDESGELEWVAPLVDGLLAVDVEARLLSPVPTPGVLLSRSCLPTPASLIALRPDAVVVVDIPAREVVDAALVADRRAWTLTVTGDGDDASFGPLHINAAAGRERARIGRAVSPSSLARLVHRLGAGPRVPVGLTR